MTDHLKEAIRLLSLLHHEEDTGPSAEQIVATRAVASALVAIAERLDDKVEVAGKMKASEDLILVKWRKEINGRLDKIEHGQELQARFNVSCVSRMDIMQECLGEIERNLPDALPRVGAWQRCGECEGKGIDPDPDEEGARCGVCGGRGMVEVYVGDKVGRERHCCKACGGDGYSDMEVGKRCDICCGSGVVHLPVAEAQPVLADHPDYRRTIDAIVEEANADIVRLKRQAARDDEQYIDSMRYTKSLENKLNDILNLLKKNLPLDELEKEILKAMH